MFMIVRHYTSPYAFLREERVGPFASLNEFDEAAYSFRDTFFSYVYIEEDGVRRRYSFASAMERRRERMEQSRGK